MPPRRRVDVSEGQAALARCLEPGADPARHDVATAVRYTLEELGLRAPGRNVEVRVPPFGVVQCVEGPRHTRGTPPNVVETDASTWLALVTGAQEWDAAAEQGLLLVSGTRADLTAYLPLVPPDPGTSSEGR
jgi:hypothetical protein